MCKVESFSEPFFNTRVNGRRESEGLLFLQLAVLLETGLSKGQHYLHCTHYFSWFAEGPTFSHPFPYVCKIFSTLSLSLNMEAEVPLKHL
jgi:hypothetical protein